MRVTKAWQDEELLARLEMRARVVRATCVQLAHDGKESHLNGALSCADLLVALHGHGLRRGTPGAKDPDRDVLIFSKGHACVALYAAMAQAGEIPVEWLGLYAKEGSPLPSHPCVHALPALDCSSGSLGHGLSVATGRAWSQRMLGSQGRTVALLSDGECNEGSTWEAAMFAAAHHMDNLIAIVDYNGIQSVGRTDELTGGASFEEKFRAFGWAARTVNGHDFREILEALDTLPYKQGKPSCLIAKTVAGRGIPRMEDQVLWHYRTPSDEDLSAALKALGVSPLHFPKEVAA